MFNSLRGILTEKNITAVCLDTGGIEWSLAVTTSTLEALPSIGQEVRLYTWLLHRDDSMQMFGFMTYQKGSCFWI